MKKKWSIIFELEEKEYKEIDEALNTVACYIGQGNDRANAKEAITKLIKYFSGEGDNK